MKDKTISGYTIQRRLGVGGMAEVWYAENKIGKNAAVKVLLPEMCRNENIVERFLTEAKTMVMLDHPNIRKVYDYGDIDGCPAIVMEYLEGEDLKMRMKHGERFSDNDLIKWWNQLVDALKYTHSKGVIHRDIKPGNIFADKDDNIKLLDFGIAKVRDSISSTQTGQKIGTLMYMSPEQVKDSKHIDYHTDIYSLAVTFVHLVTGKKPYNSETTSDFDIQNNIVSKPLDLSALPEKWRNFLSPYLNKDASQRPELRHFDESNDETFVDVGPSKPAQPEKKPEKAPEKKPEVKPEKKPEMKSEGKKKSKVGLWIGIGIAAFVVLVLLLAVAGGGNNDTSADTATNSGYAANTDYDWQNIPKYESIGDFFNVRERNVMDVFMDHNGNLMVDGRPRTISELKDIVKNFITPDANAKYAPEVEFKEIDLLGTVMLNKSMINVSVESSASNTLCANLITEIVKAYTEKRDEVAYRDFHKHYSDLITNPEQLDAVKYAVPIRVVGIGDYSDFLVQVVDNDVMVEDYYIDNNFLERCTSCMLDKNSSLTIVDMMNRFEKKNSKDLFAIIVVEREVVYNTPVESPVEEEVTDEDEIFMIVEEEPEFPGGPAKLLEYIQQNLKYPMEARENNIQGKVIVSFVVEKDGSISNVKVLRGIGGGCDAEAVRVIESLPKFKPGKQRGNLVRVSYTLPINFVLN